MADETIRSFSIYLNGKKFGIAQGHAYDVETGSELQMGDGQVVGVSQGVPTTQIVSDCIILFGGDSNMRQLEEAALQHKLVQVGVGVVNGRIHKIDMYCSKFSYKGDTVKGTCMGSFTFIGGAPKFAG
jgi:hypothetical protein